MANKNYKRQYYARKFKKEGDSSISLKKAEFNAYLDEYANKNQLIDRLERGRYYTPAEMKHKLFEIRKEEENIIDEKLYNVTNTDLSDKLDTISSILGKYIKHSKKWLFIRNVGGLMIGFVSIGLFVYGKIRIDTLFDLLKLVGSSIGLS